MYTHLKSLLIFIGASIVFPTYVFGASVMLESTSDVLHVGDIVVLKVILNTEGEKINTVEGLISVAGLSDSVVIKDFSVANTPFRLWPRSPSLSSDNTLISFVGGIPQGLKGENMLVFSIIVEAVKQGVATFDLKGVNVLLHDGKGTVITPKLSSKVIKVIDGDDTTIIKDEWISSIASDVIPPAPFNIDFGSDYSLFEGKKFISFSTTDSESGIDYYVVTEGDLSPVRSGSTYVLQNQESSDKITVVAFDKAGNTTSATYDPNQKQNFLGFIVGLLLFIGCALFLFFWTKRHV